MIATVQIYASAMACVIYTMPRFSTLPGNIFVDWQLSST